MPRGREASSHQTSWTHFFSFLFPIQFEHYQLVKAWSARHCCYGNQWFNMQHCVRWFQKKVAVWGHVSSFSSSYSHFFGVDWNIFKHFELEVDDFNLSFCGRYWCREMTSSANTLISLYCSVIIWSASTPGWISFPWRNDGQTYSATVKTQEKGNCFLVRRLRVWKKELWELYTAKEKETLLMEEAKKVKMESDDKRAFTRWERALVCVSSYHQEVER